MSSDRIDDLLQECLEAHNAGLTPEECLSAWPEHRDQLEPLLRQALRLRMAYTATPREEFSASLREKVLFAAGREVRSAFTAEPDPAFVIRTRNRLRYAAGANAQESLRAVPPPRLAFWTNTRRHLLEAAANGTVRSKPQPIAPALRTALSAAIVVLALTISGLAYLTSSHSGPRSTSAELASIEQQLQRIEAQAASGTPVQTDVIVDLSRRTAVLAEKANSADAPGPLAERLPALIERQKDVVSQAVGDSNVTEPALKEAQQQLSQAEERIRVLAARSDTPPAPEAQSTVAPASTVTTLAVSAPTQRPPAAPTATPALLGAGQFRVSVLASDTTFGLNWIELSTDSFHVALPATWTLVGVILNAQGVATLESSRVRVDGPDGVILLVGTGDGQLNALVNEQVLALRGPGPTGKAISVDELVAKAAPVARELSHVIGSVVLIAPTATPSPSTSPTTTASPSATP